MIFNICPIFLQVFIISHETIGCLVMEMRDNQYFKKHLKSTVTRGPIFYFYVEITANPHVVVRNRTEGSCGHFTWSLPVVTPCTTTAQTSQLGD